MSPPLEQVRVWVSRVWSRSFFARLAWLLVAVAISSHLLALSLLFELHPMPPPTGPHPGPPQVGMWLDITIRLGAVLLAAWVGARWLSRPLQALCGHL
jgi:hypothetical protein